MEELIISGLAGMDVFPAGEVDAKPAKRRGEAEQKQHPRGNPEAEPATEDEDLILVSSGLAGMDLFFPTGQEESEPAKAAKKRGVKAKLARRVKLPPTPSLTLYRPEPPRVFEEELHAIPDYRGRWDALFAREYGSFEDQTNLGPMRHTFGPIPRYAVPECTLQVFHIRAGNLKDGLQWPLHVHGMVAARDHADHNRNFLFHRTRDNCQILTQEARDPYLLLTDPSRAIVEVNPITLVQLKVKSKSEPEKDELLAFSIFNYHKTYFMENVMCGSCCCRRCDIEFAYASLVPSVEATVAAIQVVDGTWPDCLRGRVAARITSIKESTVVLLDSREGAMPISCLTGAIELSRRVVSVNLKGGELVISVVASSRLGGEDAGVVVAQGEAVFKPKKAGTSHGTCELGFCRIKVTVAWSLFSTLRDLRFAAAKRVTKIQ